MKYKKLTIPMLQEIYQDFYKIKKNDNKELQIDVLISQDDPNISKDGITYSKFIPNGDLKEQKAFKAKTSIIHKNYLMSNKLPYSPNQKAGAQSAPKIFYLCGKSKSREDTSWEDEFGGFHVCRPDNTLSANGICNDIVYIDINLKITAKAKTKAKAERKSPTQSATLFKEKKVLIGNDGNKWIVTKNVNGTKRWKILEKKM